MFVVRCNHLANAFQLCVFIQMGQRAVFSCPADRLHVILTAAVTPPVTPDQRSYHNRLVVQNATVTLRE